MSTFLFGLVLIAIVLAIYFTPTIVANSRAHPDEMAIFVLNLLLGWLLIPWVIALVWAYKEKTVVRVASDYYRDFSNNDISAFDNQQSECRKCPFCAEEIKREAIKCKHCGSELEPLPAIKYANSVGGEMVELMACLSEDNFPRPKDDKQYFILIQSRVDMLKRVGKLSERQRICAEAKKLLIWFNEDYPNKYQYQRARLEQELSVFL